MDNLASIKSPYSLLDGLPRYESLVHMFKAAVDARPDVTAIVWDGREIDYRQFGRAVEGLRRHLSELGVNGERVILMMPNLIEMDVALMAVMAAGAQVAPINPFFKEAELAKVIPVAQAKVLICDASTSEKAHAVAAQHGIETVMTLGPGGQTIDAWIGQATLEFAPSSMPAAADLALLIFTGGSTGIPKGVDHTHEGLMWSLYQHASVWPLEFGNEVFLNVAPMFHIWGLAYSTWIPIYSQSTLVMVPRYDPDKVVAGLAEHKVTVFAGGPAPIYMGLLTGSVS